MLPRLMLTGLIGTLLATLACQPSVSPGGGAPAPADPPALDAAATAYVKLVLAAGRHDALYVDAYYGPAEWRTQAEAGEPVAVAELLAQARGLLATVRGEPGSARQRSLEKQLVAVETFLRRLSGEALTLAEEAKLLFDIEEPACGDAELDAAKAKLEALLPGEGSLSERMLAVRRTVEIPVDKLPPVVDRALGEVRQRTVALLKLPAREAFQVKYVTGKPWSAYNWYQGGAQSIIEICTDLPISIESVLDLMAHEGYPGHHAYNALLEDRLVRGRGWVEYTVYPLYSPQSVIAEGTADTGLDVIMTKDEQRAFVVDVLAPLGGIDQAAAARWLGIVEANEPLRCKVSRAAKMLLAERKSEAEAEAFLVGYGSPPERAKKALPFIQTYRSYIYTYDVGRTLVEQYLRKGPDPRAQFFGLLERPVVPSEL